MDDAIRYLIFHFTEYFFMFWPALIMMNETEDGKLPDLRKLSGVIFLNYLVGIIANVVPRVIEAPILELLHMPILVIPMLFCCIIFTGGVVKILISFCIVDMWIGVGEILMTVIYCLICGQKPIFIFLPFYKGNLLLQWLVECIVIFLMTLLTRPLFHKYRNSSIFKEKISIMVVLFYCIVCAAWPENAFKLQKGSDDPVYWSVLFRTVFINVILILLWYNRKKIMDAKLQSLYLKQKMEKEYTLVFADMDRDMRRFRHDVKKHMDALAYMAKNEKVTIPVALLEKYWQDLRTIYSELTYGNYCGQYDINLVLMQLENVCREKNVQFSVTLKNLDLNSLPVYIRVQLFEILSGWAENAMEAEETVSEKREKKKQYLSFEGISSAGFHTLKLSVQQESPVKREQKIKMRIRNYMFTRNMSRKIKKLLYEYNPHAKAEYNNGEGRFVISWHGKK